MRRFRIAILLAILAGALLAVSALAMASTNYRLDWFVPLSGGGVTQADSASYAAQFTYGQTAIRSASSPGYRAGLGFWNGIVTDGWQPPEWHVFLPITLK